MADIALWSKGAVTYQEVKSMSQREMEIFSKRLAEYMKAQAKAGPQL